MLTQDIFVRIWSSFSQWTIFFKPNWQFFPQIKSQWQRNLFMFWKSKAFNTLILRKVVETKVPVLDLLNGKKIMMLWPFCLLLIWYEDCSNYILIKSIFCWDWNSVDKCRRRSMWRWHTIKFTHIPEILFSLLVWSLRKRLFKRETFRFHCKEPDCVEVKLKIHKASLGSNESKRQLFCLQHMWSCKYQQARNRFTSENIRKTCKRISNWGREKSNLWCGRNRCRTTIPTRKKIQLKGRIQK